MQQQNKRRTLRTLATFLAGAALFSGAVQAAGYDCGAMGGTCGGGQCRNLPAGAPCAGDLLACADGLDCAAGTDGVERCE